MLAHKHRDGAGVHESLPQLAYCFRIRNAHVKQITFRTKRVRENSNVHLSFPNWLGFETMN